MADIFDRDRARPEAPTPVMSFDEFNAWLHSDQAPENGMEASELDGFLTGLVVGPDVIPPSEWLPVIFDGPPEFGSEAEATAVPAPF